MIMGSMRVSGAGAAESEGGASTLGALIDVRPKKLHSMMSTDGRKSMGKPVATKDNIKTVIGTEGVLIQSKPRGSEHSLSKIKNGKKNSVRSRTNPQPHLLST